jgi:glycosyltransferase involved in cell wall biosynthesis
LLALRHESPEDYVLRELHRCHPDHPALESLPTTEWRKDPGAFLLQLREAGLFFNRRIFDSAQTVIVHDPWCVEQARRLDPIWPERTVVIPHGIAPGGLQSAEERAAVRARFDLPRNAMLLAAFGELSDGKMNCEALAAFCAVAREDPSALFVFVGKDGLGTRAHEHAKELNLLDRVRFLGHVALDDFRALASAVDIGVNLRRPPTNGETSGSLLALLAAGTPTVVTDVDTFSSYPADSVVKLSWGPDFEGRLARSLLDLVHHADRREQLRQAAQRHVRTHHDWRRVADLYADVIERAARAKQGRPALRPAA